MDSIIDCEKLIRSIVASMNDSFGWESWIQFGLTFLAIMVALFGREFVDWLKRPKIELDFDKSNTSHFHEIYFDLFKHGNNIHYSKGVNCLIMVSNPQKTRFFLQTHTAKGIEAKITYIYQGDRKFTYHPTNLNWSGTRGSTNRIDIISGSHHFLDFINIRNYEDEFWIDDPDKPGGKKKSAITPDEGPLEYRSNKINFQPWIIGDFGGLPKMFYDDGIYKIHFVINGKNCVPHKYVATIQWNKTNWKDPDIKIKLDK